MGAHESARKRCHKNKNNTTKTWDTLCRCCSKCIIILELKPGFNILHKCNFKNRREKLSLGIWCVYYYRFDGTCKQTSTAKPMGYSMGHTAYNSFYVWELSAVNGSGHRNYVVGSGNYRWKPGLYCNNTNIKKRIYVYIHIYVYIYIYIYIYL